MSPEEEEAVQAELEALQREAMVSPARPDTRAVVLLIVSPLCLRLSMARPKPREWSCRMYLHKNQWCQSGKSKRKLVSLRHVREA
jgi:hypothetical protein